jgi:hypothetical protein
VPDEPSLADLFNIPLPDHYEFDGKKYPARRPTKVEQGMFCRWLEAEAAAFVERQTHLPPDALERHRAGLRADAAGGKFGYYSPAAVARLNTIEGTAKLLSIVLLADGYGECDHEFCTRMLVAQAEKTAVATMEREADGDPKVRATLEMFRTLQSGPTDSCTSTHSAS